MQVTDEVLWEAKLRKFEVGDMNDEEIKTLQSELNRAIQRVLWEYGIHN